MNGIDGQSVWSGNEQSVFAEIQKRGLFVGTNRDVNEFRGRDPGIEAAFEWRVHDREGIGQGRHWSLQF